MLNKVGVNREIVSAHRKDFKKAKQGFYIRILEHLLNRSNLIMIGIYFGILIYFNNQAFRYLDITSTQMIPIFFALTVIQFGLGFLLIATTIKRNGSNRR